MNFLKSKKLIVALIGVIVALVSTTGIDIPQQIVGQVVNLIMVYLGSQGAVDIALVVKGSKTK